MSIWASNIEQHLQVIGALRDIGEVIEDLSNNAALTLSSGGKLIFCGNGGSAADCQHLAAELTGRFMEDRRPLAALALSTDSSALTCIANDYAFDHVFARQLEALGNEGDLLFAISTSGNSRNVLNAVSVAKQKGIKTVGFLGKAGGRLLSMCDWPIVVPSDATARIQEAHILIGHSVCELIEKKLGLS